MLIGIIVLIVLGIGCYIIGCVGSYQHEEVFTVLGIICVVGIIVLLIAGFFTGFINYPPTEGMHQGVITAVDLEGVWFRRYEVYLKSTGHTNQRDGTKYIQSDETKYLIYADEKELAEELQSLIGQEVKLYYGHDGGYIGWKSCGTYHIKKVEKVEE